MGRYLLFLSYIGTPFSGLQKQACSKLLTVVGTLEETMQKLYPAHPVRIVTSSRTDRGVHALCNTVHVDLDPGNKGFKYEPREMARLINKAMQRQKHPIRIIEVRPVANNFHSRFLAVGRSYVYRIAQCMNQETSWAKSYNIMENMHSYIVTRPLNIGKVHEVADVLQGTHDFSAFTNITNLKDNPWINPVKTLRVQVQQGNSFLGSQIPVYDKTFQHWDIEFYSHSFLYKQIRRMMSAMLAVGQGRMEVNEVRGLLENPKKEFPPWLAVIPSHGLYLKGVHYLEKDLEAIGGIFEKGGSRKQKD